MRPKDTGPEMIALILLQGTIPNLRAAAEDVAGRDSLFELVCEGHLVQEHPGIPEPLVEAVFELLHA